MHSTRQCKPVEWLDAAGLAALAGIHRQQASAALALCRAGGTWRGVVLEVVEQLGRRGHGGRRYLVAEHSLPVELRLARRRATRRQLCERAAGRLLVVHELERVEAEHGRRRAVELVLARANDGDLRQALSWASGIAGAARELTRASLCRWELEFRNAEEAEELAPLLHEARLARRQQEREREHLPAEKPPADPRALVYKVTLQELRQATRRARARPAPDPMPRRVRVG